MLLMLQEDIPISLTVGYMANIVLDKYIHRDETTKVDFKIVVLASFFAFFTKNSTPIGKIGEAADVMDVIFI